MMTYFLRPAFLLCTVLLAFFNTQNLTAAENRRLTDRTISALDLINRNLAQKVDDFFKKNTDARKNREIFLLFAKFTRNVEDIKKILNQ
jgi:hypothetical protein